MNNCCKSLLYKGLCLSKDLNSFRLISTMKPNYTVINQNIISFPNDYKPFKSQFLFKNKTPALLIHSHSNHLARNSKKSSSSSVNSSPKTKNKQEVKVKNKGDVYHQIKPMDVNPIMTVDNDDIGVQLGGNISKAQINEILSSFKQSKQVEDLVKEHGLNARMFYDSMINFRKFCLISKALPPELHLKFFDIQSKAANVMDLFPYYWKHVNEMYPHLVCKGDLLKVSDLTEPSYWYMEAREIKRKIIYHCGPTNSGKTYSALLKFQSSKSGIYCGPLKLLANEVYSKTNNANTPCDLITGEERKFSISELEIANHVACTVEMTNLEKDYEVAVIDEIQMIKDPQRGWAWTRALLGLKAKEIHVCGDSSAIDLISDLSFLTNDELKIENYERLTTLKIEEKALESLKNVQPGDCFVCFNKKELFNIAKNLESLGHEVALIYGSMPPTVKLLQQKKFNDPSHPCKILVATDAIGMGLNLNISRIIFTSLVKQQQRSKGDEQPHINNSDEISTSQALQIAGRAGRYNTQFSRGLVTTLNSQDLPRLREILKQKLPKTLKAGLHPTSEQIELFAFHLPNHSLSSLLQIFVDMCTLNDGQYFLCNFEDQIENAALIDHLPIKIKAKYTFACSPINSQNLFVASRLVNFARAYSENEAVTIENLKNQLRWSSLRIPENIESLVHLENIYDVLDLYLWLSFRFPAIFSYQEQVKEMRIELESLVEKGIERFLREKNKKTSFRTTSSRSLNKLENKILEESSDTSEKLKNLQIKDLSKYNNLIQNNNQINSPYKNPDVKQSSKSAVVNNNQIEDSEIKLTKIKDSEILVEKTSIQSTDKNLVKNQITSKKITKNDLVESKNHLKEEKQSKSEKENTDGSKQNSKRNDASYKDSFERTQVKVEKKSGNDNSNTLEKNPNISPFKEKNEKKRRKSSSKTMITFDPSKHDPICFLTDFFITKGYKKPEFISAKLDNSLFKSEVIIQDCDGIRVFKSNGLHGNINSAKIQAALNALNSLGLNKLEPIRDFVKNEDPIEYLDYLFRIKKWDKLVYKTINETNEPHVLVKVDLNGTTYQPLEPSLDYQKAKRNAALHCLKSLGYAKD